MILSDDELRELSALLVSPCDTVDKRMHILRLAFPNNTALRAAVSVNARHASVFTSELVDYWYHNNIQALITILMVIQQDQGGALAQQLQPFVDKLKAHGTSGQPNAQQPSSSGATPPPSVQLNTETVRPAPPVHSDIRPSAGLRAEYESIATLVQGRLVRGAWQSWHDFKKSYPHWRGELGGDPKGIEQFFLQSFTQLRTFDQHTMLANSIAWSPDGRFLASGSGDHTICIWDIHTGDLKFVLTGHGDSVNSVAWSPNREFLVSGSSDNTVRLWNAQNGQSVRVLRGHEKSVLSVAWSADGSHIASAACDHTIRLWNPQNGRCLRTFEGHTDWVRAVAWSASNRLISGSNDKTIRFWDTQTGNSQRFPANYGWITSIARMAEEDLFVLGTQSGDVVILNAQNGYQVYNLEGHDDQVFSVAWAPNSPFVASGAGDKTVRIWDVENRELIHMLTGHDDTVWSVAWAPNGRYLASGYFDGTVIIWGIASE